MSRLNTPLHAACSAFLAVGSVLLGVNAHAQDVAWRYEYEKARKEAVEKGRPLVIDFVTDNCFWCKKLEATTFKDPNVLATMNERFIPLKIDAERDSFLAQRLQIQSYPTIVLASPDGQILRVIEGFKEPPVFLDHLQFALNSVGPPAWMVRDFDLAGKAIAATDYAQAIQLLRKIVQDGKDRPIQLKAQQSLRDLEQLAQTRLASARQFAEKGQSVEARETVAELVRRFAGTQAAEDGNKMLASLTQSPEPQNNPRTARARELLTQAREDFRMRDYRTCLSKCRILTNTFYDLPEGQEGEQLEMEIKGNPEWLKTACDSLRDELTALSLSQAEAWLKKGQPQQAIVCLEQIVQQFPNSRQAEIAQVRLSQIQGQPTRPVDFKRP